MDHGRLREVLRQAAHPDDFPLLVQRVPGSGTLQGDAIAEDLFLEAYHPVVDAWTADLGWQHCDYQVLAFSPLDLATIDLAVTTFADDLCRKIFVESPEDANQKVRRSNQALGPWPQQAWHRTPANKNMWLSLAANTSTATTAKFSINNCYQEKQSPLPNIWAAFRPTIFLLCMSLISGYPALLLHGAHFEVSAWYSRGLPWRGLRGIFLGMVYEVLFSGLEVLLLSTGHLQRLDRVVLGYGCKLMRGKGCIQTQTDTGDTKYKELPNLEVFSYLGVAPAYTELRIRRLKFLQMLARDPFKHVQIITAIFGTFDFDAEPTLDPLQGVDPSANKYALLFWKDLQALACLDSAHWLLEIADGNIIAFLTDLASDFIHVMLLSSVPRTFLCTSLPLDRPVLILWKTISSRCQMNLCNTVILCLKTAACVENSFIPCVIFCYTNDGAKRSTTVQFLIFFKAAHVNQCPWCFMVHANIISTRRHIRQRLHTGVCPLIPGAEVLFSRTQRPLPVWCANFAGIRAMTCCSFFLTSDLISRNVHFSMDGWRSRPAGPGDGDVPAGKVRAVSPNEDTVLLRKAVALVSKMTLCQELEIRELQAAVFRCFLLKEPNPIIGAMKTSVGTFWEKAKQARAAGGNNSPVGEVHAHACAAVTEVAAAQPSLESLTKNAIVTHQAAMTHPDMVAGIVYLAKLKKAFNKGEYKLLLGRPPGAPRPVASCCCWHSGYWCCGETRHSAAKWNGARASRIGGPLG